MSDSNNSRPNVTVKHGNIHYSTRTDKFEVNGDAVTKDQMLRYLKGRFSNQKRMIDEFFIGRNGQGFRQKNDLNKEICDFLIDNYKIAKRFTYKEAFEIKSDSFQAMVFATVDITEMIKELGHKRIATEGITVQRKVFSKEGEFEGFKEYENIYEVHEVDGKKLTGRDRTKLYAVKCWCTSTNKEHWLWIEDQYKEDPLQAIASTFRVHENVIPHIKELKRQGDLMLVELDEEVEPSGNIRPLTKDEYFDLLSTET